MALLGSNGCFMSVDEEGDIVCTSKKAGPGEFLQVTFFHKKILMVTCNRTRFISDATLLCRPGLTLTERSIP